MTEFVLTPGRWRVRVKFGRYRIGFHRGGPGVYSWGLGFCTGNAVRRSR
jgi:hypothetical protein